MLVTGLLFAGTLTLVILIHEWGHFFAAKKMGMKVEEFGIGFPPRVWGKKFGEVLYSINLLPVGGFVRIFGEDGDNRNDPRSFASKSILRRTLVIVAGVSMNLILAYALFTVVHLIEKPAVYISNVALSSPAMNAGLLRGDKIIEFRFEDVVLSDIGNSEKVVNFINLHGGESINFVVERTIQIDNTLNKEIIDTTVLLRTQAPPGQGLSGIEINDHGGVVWYKAPIAGLKTTYFTTIKLFESFSLIVASIISSASLPEGVSGPIGIAAITGEVRALGFVIFLQFIALISLNLAILNLIPFPALDGGRFLFLMIEKIKGSPVDKKVEGVVHATGFAILIIFIIWVSINDVGKFL